MRRSEFIQSLLGFGALGLVPNTWVKLYDKIYLLQCFIAGFRYYEGSNLMGELKDGEILRLVREPQNKFDEMAIALYWNDKKVGFVPAALNEVLARLLDSKALDLYAEMSHIEPDAEPWEKVHVGSIFCGTVN